MLTQMVTETLLGALTGYVTNHTAIRSLFQPGGVIEKTRDDFAREAGRLLEDQVLTRVVLARQLALPEVQQVIGESLEDFFQQQLPSALEDKTFGDLPDWDSIAAFLQETLTRFLQQERETILLLFRKYLPLHALLTETQCKKLSSQLEQVLLETIQQQAVLEQFWNGWQAEKGQQTLGQLGLQPLCQIIVEHISEAAANWQTELVQQYGSELEAALKETIKALQLRPVLLELDERMAQYTLGQYLRCDENEAAALLQNVVQSPQGQQLLALAASELLQALEAVDEPLTAVLPEELLQQVKPLLQQQIPLVLEQLINWLQQNRQAVGQMLEGAVDEVAAETGGMKGMLLEQLKDSVLEQVLQQADLGQFVQQYVLQEQTGAEAAAMLMEAIGQQLDTHSLGELVQRMNSQHRLEKLLQLLFTENLQRMLQHSDTDLIQLLLNWKPGSFHLAERQQQVEDALAVLLLRGVQQMDLQAWILQQGDKLEQWTVPQIVQMDSQQLNSWAEQMIRQGCRYLEQQLPQQSADTIYRPLYEALEQLVERQGTAWLKQVGAGKKLQDVLLLLQTGLAEKQPQLVQLLTEMGLDMAQGRLSKLAEDQIRQLSNAEMLQLVEDFMGRELQPLNYLGAGMGAVAGATVGTALSTALPVTAAVSPALLLSVLAGKSAVFGAVGYGTNCAAVKGLFWPYEPVGGVEMLQGVIPKQKTRFAHSMGNLVDRYVINEDVLRQLLMQSRPQWSAYAMGLAAAEDQFRQLAAEIAAHRQQMAAYLWRWLEQQGPKTCNHWLEKLGGMPFAFLQRSQQKGILQLETVLSAAEGWLNQQLHRDLPLRQLLSAEQLWTLLETGLTEQAIPDLPRLGRTLLYQQQSLEQLIGAEPCSVLADTVQTGVVQWLAEPLHHRLMARQCSRVLTAERIRQWLEQHSDIWLEQNLSSLFQLVSGTVLQLLQSRQDTITAAVQAAILDRMGLMQQLGYTMMDGDAIVAQVVDRVLQQKLPIFLSVKQKELQNLFTACWRQQIFPALLQMPLQQNQIGQILRRLLEQPALYQCAGHLAAQAVQLLTRCPVAAWGRLLHIDSLLETVQMQLGFHWRMHGKTALQSWRPLVVRFYEEKAGRLTLAQLSRGYTATLPFGQILRYENLPELLRSVELRLRENIAITRPQQWLNWPETAAVLEQGLQRSLQDEQLRQWFLYEAEHLILSLCEQWQRLLPQQSREALLQPVVQAVFSSAEAYGNRLLAAMDLSRLAEVQLTAMDNAHLEQVVRGFASQYLVHIENRGWLGALFALPGMLIYLL